MADAGYWMSDKTKVRISNFQQGMSNIQVKHSIDFEFWPLLLFVLSAIEHLISSIIS
jgi:hypothetical protein